MRCKIKFQLRRFFRPTNYLCETAIFTGQFLIVRQLIQRYRPRYNVAQQWFAEAGLILSSPVGDTLHDLLGAVNAAGQSIDTYLR